MKNKTALLLYFVAFFVFMLAIVLHNDELMLVSKPVIVPAIFFYYLQEKTAKLDWSYVLIITMFFIGDMIVLVDLPNFFVVIVSVFLIAYLVFLKGLLDDLITIRLRFVNKAHLFTLLICVFFLIFLLISVMDILLEAKQEYMELLVFYGMILVVLGVIASLNYIVKPSRHATFMVLASLAFVISDVFYILKEDFFEFTVFTYLNNFTQILSYYFVTKYYILKEIRQ